FPAVILNVPRTVATMRWGAANSPAEWSGFTTQGLLPVVFPDVVIFYSFVAPIVYGLHLYVKHMLMVRFVLACSLHTLQARYRATYFVVRVFHLWWVLQHPPCACY